MELKESNSPTFYKIAHQCTVLALPASDLDARKNLRPEGKEGRQGANPRPHSHTTGGRFNRIIESLFENLIEILVLENIFQYNFLVLKL